MNQPLLELRDVSRTYARDRRRRGQADEVHAARRVSLTIAAGETLALVGESGAGKSTIGQIVLGLQTPDTGEVHFDGANVTHLRGRARRRLRRRMQLILQDPYQSLHPGMRVDEAVAEPLAIAGVARDERHARVVDALDDVGLTPAERFLRRHPHELSGGQRQRVAMARAFVVRPSLVVADEPTSMLDASLRGEILALMASMGGRAGMSTLLITHDLAAARILADRVAVMRAGEIVEHGPIDRVLAAPAHHYTRVLLAASEGRLLEEDP